MWEWRQSGATESRTAASRALQGPSERGVELPIVNMSVCNGGESSERGLSFLLKGPTALANVPARGPLERPPGRVRLGWWPLAAGFLAGSYAGVRSLESSGAGAGVRGRGGNERWGGRRCASYDLTPLGLANDGLCFLGPRMARS